MNDDPTYQELQEQVRGLEQTVSDLRLAQDAMQEREDIYRNLLEKANDGIVIVQDWKVKYTNALLAAMVGLEVEDLKGADFLDFVHPEDRTRITDVHRGRLQGEELPARAEFVLKNRTGADLIVETSSSLVIYHGKPAIFSTIRDITDRRNADRIIKENEESFRNLFENAQVGIIRTRLSDGIVLEANNRIIEMFGFESKEDIIGRVSVVDLYEDPETRDRMFSELSEHGEVRNFEARFKSKPGTTTWIRFSGVVNQSEGYLEGVASDITEIKNAELERTRLEEQYRQAQKVEAIGRLAGGVAHDMNNLLVPIVGYSELLLEHFDPNDRLYHSVKQISEAGDRCRDLVQQLLAFGRKQTLEYQAIDINHAIVDFSQLLRRTIRENVEIKTVLSPEIETINADIGQIEQVIMNLCVNAQDAMPDGGKLIIETALVEIEKDDVLANPGVRMGRYAVLVVSDTGFGMDETTKKQIFEPFYSTKGTSGTGLGLATVYGIVMQHGGNISVYSEVGKGTTFKIYLPVSDAHKESAEETELGVEDVRGTETILLVEDNQQVRDLGDQALTVFGYRVLAAKDGPEAMEILSSYGERIHLLLTDVIMPGMNGRQLYEKAIEILPKMRVLYMSGYTDNVIAHHGVLKDGVELIQKPFSVLGLATRVREVLEA